MNIKGLMTYLLTIYSTITVSRDNGFRITMHELIDWSSYSQRHVITERDGHCDAWTQQSNNSCVTKRNPWQYIYYPNLVVMPVDNNEHQRIDDVSTDHIFYNNSQ